jgi:hypothetical protein
MAGSPFWEHADKFLIADGELLRLHDVVRAAQAQPEEPVSPEQPAAGRTVRVADA